jgi:hypothetical protein
MGELFDIYNKGKGGRKLPINFLAVWRAASVRTIDRFGQGPMRHLDRDLPETTVPCVGHPIPQ